MVGKTNIDKATEILLNNISKGDSKTITSLLRELDSKVRYSLLKQGLELRDIEEVLLDSVTILVQKVRNGHYEDRGIPVIVYLIKIAKIRSFQYLRKNKLDLVPLTNDILANCNGELKALEDWDQVNAAIEKLPANQKLLIELTYFKNIPDETILSEKLTAYSSIESVRTQRYKAVKKLCGLLNTKTS